MSLKGHTAYLDANTVIYAIEGTQDYSNLNQALLEPLEEGEIKAVTSLLTLVETIVGVRKSGDAATEANYREFLTPTEHLAIEPVSSLVLEKVIELRAQFGIKIPDAIHIATGMLAGCTVFVSRDATWSKLGVNVVGPQELVP